MSLLTHLQNWMKYSDVKDRLDAESVLRPVQPERARPARTEPARREQLERFRDSFEASSASPAKLQWAPKATAAQVKQAYFGDGFEAPARAKVSLGNDAASLTFGAASAPQDTSFTPTLADVELLLGAA